MPRAKAKRISGLNGLPNVVANYDREHGWPRDEKLSWPCPISMELGCGRAEFLLHLATEFPSRVFVGVDKKAARLWAGANAALRRELDNTFFIRSEVEYLPEICTQGIARDIWLLFPDPYPQFGKSQKRLTSSRFLNVYRYLLAPGGLVHLKTDDERLYRFTLETLKCEGCLIHAAHVDVHGSEALGISSIQTVYERRHILAGRTIHYVSFEPGQSA